MTILLGAAFCSGSGKLICRALEVSQGCSCAPPRSRLHPGRDLGQKMTKQSCGMVGCRLYGGKKKKERKGNKTNLMFSISGFPKGGSGPVKCPLPYNSSQPYWLSLEACSSMGLSTSGATKNYEAWWVRQYFFLLSFLSRCFFPPKI